MAQNKNAKNALVYLFAVIGAAAVLYGGWIAYERYVAEQSQRSFFSEPASSGLPNPLGATPGPPPPP